MLTIENIQNIKGQAIKVKGKQWVVTGVTVTDAVLTNGKSQYQFYLTNSEGNNFRTICLDRIIDTPKNSCNIINKDYYKLHTSQNVRYVSTEELRSIGSTMYWMEQVCE
jgi:hypothetical protein